MSDKGFKTIDEQLEILRTRGLTIHDDQKAKEFLLYNNYYRISAFLMKLTLSILSMIWGRTYLSGRMWICSQFQTFLFCIQSQRQMSKTLLPASLALL